MCAMITELPPEGADIKPPQKSRWKKFDWFRLFMIVYFCAMLMLTYFLGATFIRQIYYGFDFTEPIHVPFPTIERRSAGKQEL